MNRCTGHCCRAFSLGWTPAELRMLAEESPSPEDAADKRKIADLLVPVARVKPNDPHPGSDRFGVHRVGSTIYTCVHFDERSGDCTAYAQRPTMCSDYPYGTRCNFRSCTWTEVHGVVDRGVPGEGRDGHVHLVVVMPEAVTKALVELDAQLVAEADKARARARCARGMHRAEDGRCVDCAVALDAHASTPVFGPELPVEEAALGDPPVVFCEAVADAPPMRPLVCAVAWPHDPPHEAQPDPDGPVYHWNDDKGGS